MSCCKACRSDKAARHAMACGKDGFNGRLILDNRKGREALKPGKEALLEVLSKSTIWWRRYPFERWSRTALSASIPAMVGSWPSRNNDISIR